GLASLAYMKNTIGQVKQAASTLQTSEYLDEEAIQFIDDYIDAFESANTSLAETIGNVDKKNLLSNISRMDDFAFAAPVYAADEVNKDFASAFGALNTDTNSAASLNPGTGELTANVSWSGVKAGVKVEQTTAGWVLEKIDKNILKPAQTVVGVGLDTFSAYSKMPFDAATTLYYGNRLDDLEDQACSNLFHAYNNYQNNMSGVDTLNVAKNTFEIIENKAQEYAEKGASPYMSPWLAGQLAKFGVGVFTGLGKGIFQVANQKSSAADLVEGTLNITLSAVPFAKTLLPVSVAAKGTTAGAKVLCEKGAIALEKAWVNYEERASSKEIAAFLKETGSSGGRMEELLRSANSEGSQIMREALEEGEKRTTQELGALISKSKENIKAIPGRGKEAINDFVNKSYANTLEGFGDSLLDTFGKNPVEFWDNFLGSKADEALVDLIKSQVPDQEITPAGDSAKNTSSTTADTTADTSPGTGTDTSAVTTNVAVNGAIHIVSTPPGADIWLDNTKQSLQAPRTFREITPGDHKVVLKIPGYQDYSRTVSVTGGETAEISAKLAPLPDATGNLRIVSDQSDATIVIDGTTQDVKTPASFKNVPVGTYKITVKKAGFQDYSATVTVEPLQVRQVSASLKPLQLAKGTLNISSVPAGADIYINGQKQGSQTPANKIIEPGTYTVGLRKSGYKDYSTTVTVAEGRIRELSAKLEAVPSTPAQPDQSGPGDLSKVTGCVVDFRLLGTFSQGGETAQSDFDATDLRYTLPGSFKGNVFTGEKIIESKYGGKIQVTLDSTGTKVSSFTYIFSLLSGDVATVGEMTGSGLTKEVASHPLFQSDPHIWYGVGAAETCQRIHLVFRQLYYDSTPTLSLSSLQCRPDSYVAIIFLK
ncbi:MAG: PEGA domain-containing protein, partial [Dehalococcoidia bacterium]|nr:PEGA domain-containing protein [Dehalococcoidia bacterium]